MEITIDAIMEAAEKAPELKDHLFSSFKDDFVKNAESNGFVVRTKEQDQEYLTSHVSATVDERVNAVLPERIGKEFGEAMRKIDESIESITGVKRTNGEKSTDYARRALQESKQGDPVTKERVAELENLLSQKEAEWNGKLAEQVNQFTRKEIEMQADAGFGEKQFAIPVHLKTDAEKQAYVDGQRRMLKNDFMSNYSYKKDAEGNTIFYKGETPLMSNKDGKPKGAREIIEENYSPYFLQPGKQATGTGTGAEFTGGGTDGLKTTDDVHNYLRAKGVDAGSNEYLVQLEKLAKENNINF